MATLEYLVVDIPVDHGTNNQSYQDKLDKLGSEEWDLVHVRPTFDRVVVVDGGGHDVETRVPHASHVFKRKL